MELIYNATETELKAVEEAASKLESLDCILERALPAKVVEPHIGPECFAVPISKYLAIVEQDNEAFAKQLREVEQERNTLARERHAGAGERCIRSAR